MRSHNVLLLISAVAAAVAANATASPWQISFKSFKGEYAIYGGGIGDPIAPSPSDRKIAIAIDGAAAKDIFNAIGPDLKEGCGAESGGRIRVKEKLSCSYFQSSGYVCHVGFDLRTGKNIVGSVC